jgi:DNA-binding MarR family transcriptional regulator
VRELLTVGVMARRLFPRGGFEDLDTTRLQVLLALWTGGEMTVRQLTEALAVAPSQTSHAVSDLVARGLADQVSDPQDARLRRQSITAAGAALTKRYLRDVDDLLALA